MKPNRWVRRLECPTGWIVVGALTLCIPGGSGLPDTDWRLISRLVTSSSKQSALQKSARLPRYRSFKKNLRHHPFIFVIEKMTVKHGHAADHRVGEIHDDVHGAAGRNIYGVQPQWRGNRLVIFSGRQEMHLMDVNRMELRRGVDNSPMLIAPNLHPDHGSGIGREFFSVDIEAVLVFSESHDELRRHFFFGADVHRF